MRSYLISSCIHRKYFHPCETSNRNMWTGGKMGIGIQEILVFYIYFILCHSDCINVEYLKTTRERAAIGHYTAMVWKEHLTKFHQTTSGHDSDVKWVLMEKGGFKNKDPEDNICYFHNITYNFQLRKQRKHFPLFYMKMQICLCVLYTAVLNK